MMHEKSRGSLLSSIPHPDVLHRSTLHNRSPSTSAVHTLDRLSDEVDEVNLFRALHPTTPLPGASSRCTGSAPAAIKDREAFRRYERAAQSVAALYAAQHEKQTVAYNLWARRAYLLPRSEGGHSPHARMTVWQALEKLDTLVDQSDPDTELSQLAHLLQTAEAMRRDKRPDWMQLVGLMHDLGKLLCFFGAEQWSVVGDTYIVGAAPEPNTIIYPDSLALCPDASHPLYSTPCGMYAMGCGLDNVMFTWGHDEYMYEILKRSTTIPKAGLDMVRFHSAYPWHSRGAYRHLMCAEDGDALRAVLDFNTYDLYSKSDAPPDVDALRPYYETLIDKYFVGGKDAVLDW